MAEDNAHVLKTLEDLKRQVVSKLEEARPLIVALNGLEAAYGLPLTSLGPELLSGPLAVSQTGQAGPAVPPPAPFGGFSRRGGPASIRPDEFLAVEPMVAAKKYLAMVGQAVTVDEIADAIQRGGADVQGANWREKLETSLSRSPYDVIKVSDKTYGLASFYSEEQLARLRGARRQKRLGTAAGKGKKDKKPVAKTKKRDAAKGQSTTTKPKVEADDAARKGAGDGGRPLESENAEQVH